MNVIESATKTIIEGQGFKYLRSVNINDLNVLVGTEDLTGGVGVYANLPSINNQRFGLSKNVLMEYAVEVYYLKLSVYTDDTGQQTSDILNDLYPFAQEYIDKIMVSDFIAPSQFVDNYQLDAIETLKLTKEVLTGWRVRVNLPIFRSTYYCP